MVSRRLATKAGVVAGVGAVVSAFGVVTPAQAYTCDITIDPTEDALRTAINDGNTTICITEGTIDMGLGAVIDNGPILFDSDLTLVGLGDVVIDGNDEAPAFLVGWNDGVANGIVDVNLVVDNLTVRNFHDWDYNEFSWGVESHVPVVGFAQDMTGTVTVLNSRFESNDSYVASVGAVDEGGVGGDSYASIVVDNTVFDNNNGNYSQVWGYSDITVTNSTFTNNYASQVSSAIEMWSSENTWANNVGIIAGNYFANNASPGESTVYLDGANAFIYNNTFAWNTSESNWAGSAIATTTDSNYTIAYNTFHENSSDASVGSISVGETTDATLIGNVFSTLEGEPAITVTDGTVSDLGGNVSTADDSDLLDSENSLNLVSEEELWLNEPADNGGSTFTMSLGDDSVAQDLLESTYVEDELGPDLALDQRGEARGGLVDSGAWDNGEGYLAATGVDATGIALTGGLVGAAGIALVTRRRKA